MPLAVVGGTAVSLEDTTVDLDALVELDSAGDGSEVQAAQATSASIGTRAFRFSRDTTGRTAAPTPAGASSPSTWIECGRGSNPIPPIDERDRQTIPA